MLDVLAIGAHPDDVELGMGGAIGAFLAEGLKVGILDLTNGEPTPFGSPEEREREAAAAADILGVAVRRTLPLTNRELQDTVEARRMVAEVIREWRPRTLFIHYWEDAHPDHVAACRLCEAARFYAKLTKTDMRGEPFYPARIFYFFSNHLRGLHPKPAFIIDTSDYMEKKLAAVKAYYTQFEKGRPEGAGPAFYKEIETRDAYWGSLIGARYGEPFVSREEIGLRGIRDRVR
ncbi:MAG: bacillithiol biosynthesis deacetylase BshB1, partial [Limnochordales bacterium]